MSESEAKEPPNEEEEAKIAKEKEDLKSYIDELKEKITTKKKLRAENLSCSRPPDEYFFKLDSSLKKNTAFVRKLKQFTSAQLDSLQKEMNALNLTKYISEVSSAIVEAKLKMTDVVPVVQLCSHLHQTYAEFSPTLFENWQRALNIKSGERVSNASKLRVDLRLFAELVAVGIFSNKSGLSLLGLTLTGLISQDKEDHSHLSIILSFCRHCGEEYAGLTSRVYSELSQKYGTELPSSSLLSSDKQQNLRNLLKDYYHTLVKHVICEHKELMNAARFNRKLMETKGEISHERKEKLDTMQGNFDKLYSSAQILSDLLNEQAIDLPVDTEANTGGIVMDMADDSAEAQLDPWGDEDTKSFYVDLPDLREFLPNYAPKQTTPVVEEEPPMTEEALDMDIEPEQLEFDESAVTLEEPKAGTPEPAVPDEPLPSTHSGGGGHFGGTKAQYDTFVHDLSKCVNREMTDSAAIDFLLNLNTRANRKKLSRSLFSVQRTRLDLLPFFARLVAIINMVHQDIAAELAYLLKHEFKFHIFKKNQMNIESKIKVVRFIGELVKFAIYPKTDAIFVLKVLLSDFQHHQIEMACAYLEVCGRYLYNTRECRHRTNVYLEQMMRMKTATALDSRHVAQIESSYYWVKPPETQRVEAKVRTPMQLYIRQLIFEELTKSNVDKTVKQMRRLDWENPIVAKYAIKCLTKAYDIRYHNIRCLADLVAGLSSYQEAAIVKVVDSVLEDIRCGLEFYSAKLSQRRIAMAKYLGEMYNYRLIEAADVLNTLYSIISLGVSFDYEAPSFLDPPNSLFRLKLACILLETCGQYFTSALSRKRLDYFLIFFQHYYWFKKSDAVFKSDDTSDLFPYLIDHYYKDCMASLRPKLKLCKDLDEAKEAVDSLRNQLYPNLLADADGDNLEAIVEDSELEDTAGETSEAINESDDEMDVRGGDVDELNDNMMDDSPEPEEEEIKPIQPTQEDLDFELAFGKMAQDSYQERLRETIKPGTIDIPVPMKIRTQQKKTYDQLQDKDPPGGADKPVKFMLMLRGAKGGKQQFKTFDAPIESALAVNLRLQEQKSKEENERVKQLTLNITERIEEEDYQESLLQAQRSPAQNSRNQRTQKQQRYKHQKGAPDADLIFS